MPKDKIKQLGVELKTVKKQGPDDPKLDRLENWVDEYLAEGAVIEEKEHHTFVQELQEAAEQYEVSHPKLTAVINQVLSTLSNMGI
jgi:hypothetical protein